MNVRRVLGLGLFSFLMCAAVAASCQPANPPQTYVKVPATITLGDLSPQQLQDRAKELDHNNHHNCATAQHYRGVCRPVD
jgi:hypothetical protein